MIGLLRPPRSLVRTAGAFVTLLLASVLLLGPVRAQTVTVTINDTSAAPGDTIDVPIKVSRLDEDTVGVTAYEFQLNFDTTAVSYVGFEDEGTLSEEAGFTVLDNPDTPQIGAFGTSPLNEEAARGTLIRIQLKVLKAGSTEVSLDPFMFNEGSPEADPAVPSFLISGVANTAPTITSIPDQEIAEDGSTGALSFTVDDAETPPESLAVRATSSVQALVPDSNLALGGEATSRTITAEPLPDSTGSTTITVTVDDSSAQKAATSTTFDLIVNPVNDPPVAVRTLPDDTLKIPGPPIQLVRVGKILFRDVDDEMLSVTASSSAPSVVSVENSGATVILRPQSVGTADITLTADDGAAQTAAEPFTITVQERPDGEDAPSDRVVAAVDSTGTDSTNVDFGSTGVQATFRDVRTGGVVQIDFFEGRGTSSSTSAASKTAAFENVSPYRWEASADDPFFGSVDLRFRLSDEDVRGIGDPHTVTVIVDSTGDGTFEPVTTRFSDGGTPSDSTDDALVAKGLTGFSTFKFASDSPDNPLPVEVTRFTATLDDGTALLQWRTASETNNAGFQVQHEPPGRDRFEKAGFVEGTGTTTTPQSYQFRISDLKSGTHTFRLRQVDTDGTGHLTDPVQVVVQMDEALRLTGPAPNPIQSEATLRFALRTGGEATLTLYNALGQRVATLYRGAPAPGQLQRVRLDASTLPSGLYLVRLQAHDQTRTARVTVTR